MVLNNKKPHFPIPDKYLAIEQNNNNIYQDSENSTESTSPPLQRPVLTEYYWEVYATDSHMCYVNQRTIPGAAYPLSFQQGLVGSSYGDK